MAALTLALVALLGAPRSSTPEETYAPAVHERLERLVKESGVPGVSVGIVTESGATAHCVGFADREQGRALDRDGLLCAGSTGKTFVAAVVLQLVAEGRLHLEDLAGEYLGDEDWFERLPNAGEMTVEHLLSHRSGLPRYVFRAEFTHHLLAEPDREWKPLDALTYVFDLPPLHPAGEGFAYSDTGFIVLGMIVERVTGSTLYGEVQRRLLDPLKLTHVLPQTGRRIPGLVQGYAGKHDPLGLPELMLDAEGRFCINPLFEWAGGGFASTGEDLARWIWALHAGDVLDRSLRERMVEGRVAPELGRGTRYGLGAMLWSTPAGEARGHAGFFPGYMSEVRYWPEARVAIAVQVNTSAPSALGMPLGRLCDELLEAVLAARAKSR